jgi:tetratricopeptide (TPR) repeat protein
MLMVAYLRPAELAYGLDQPADAAVAIEKAIAVAERLLELDVDNVDRISDVTTLLGRQASYLTQAHRLDEALVVQRRALASAEALSARVPANVDYRRGVGVQHEYLGDVFNEQGKLEDAAAEYRARLAIDQALLRSDPDNPRRKLDVASTRFLLGDTIADLPAHYAEGITLMETSVADLHALRDAGELSEEALTLIPEREQKLAVEKKRGK